MQVYDCTPFLDKHPGGKAAITMHAGQECTDDFIAAHSHAPWAWTLLEDFYIGDLVKGSAPVTNSDGATTSSDLLTTLDPKKKVAVKLISKEELSRDSRRLRFALPSPQHTLGLPIGSHLLVNATIDGTPCMRAYTPTSLDHDVGFVEMVIKVYFKNENPRFPDGGIMSQHLESLNIGDTIDIKGPVGHFEYLGRGKFKLHNKEVRQCSSMGMICGGTGITPAYQVMKAALKDKEDATQFYLLYANQTPADVLLRAQLDAWAKEHPARVHIWYTVDKVPEGTDWPFSVGFIDEEMIKKHMPKPGLNGESFVGMCGPPPMLKFACIPNLEKAGFTASDYMSF
jgi:nitrate reductase (NAD(P)H)